MDILDPIAGLLSQVSERYATHPLLRFNRIYKDVAPNYSLTFTFNQNAPINFIVVGAGGTGSHYIANLAQLISVYKKDTRFNYNISLTIVDGDVVEESNLSRQRFTAEDLGQNKAKALALRYSSVFGFTVKYLADFIDDVKLTGLIVPEATNVIVGCVDNNIARYHINRVFYQSPNSIVWLDSGNNEWNGQAVFSTNPSFQELSTLTYSDIEINKATGLTSLPTIFHWHPELLNQLMDEKKKLTCAE